MIAARVGFWIGGALLPAAVAAAPYPVVQVPVYRLTCRVMSTGGGSSVVVAERALDLEPDRAGRLELELPWGSAGEARLSVDGLREEGPEGGHRLHLDAVLRPPSGPSTRLTRTLDIAEAGTALVELHRRPGTNLVLALGIETGRRAVVGTPTGRGQPIVFHLSVERVSGQTTIPLETNELHTLVGEGVEYAFQRGTGESQETLRLRLTPVRVRGEVVELEVELEGRLPGAEAGPEIRRDRLLATRGSTTSFDAAAGTPPSGYRFRIRPDF